MKNLQTIVLLLVVATIAFTAGHSSAVKAQPKTANIWSGHIIIYKDAAGQSRIDYRTDGQTVHTTYTPSGFFETRAVSGLIKRITQTP